MTEVKKDYFELIGNTPIVELSSMCRKYETKAMVYAKLESYNPSGSVKDRIAKSMIEDALASKKISEGTTLIEPTSGNTGIGIAASAAAKGMKAIIVMPETMSIERRNLIQAYGAQVVLTPGKDGMKGAIAKAQELVQELGNAYILGQFENKANPKAHYLTTGPEIERQMDGQIDVLVAGIGTGGTISGVGAYLKQQHPHLHIVAVEPKDSPMLSEGTSGPHKIQGIGAGFVPDTLNTNIYDEIITISNEDAFAYGKALAKTQGILAGISSGAALAAAMEIAKRDRFAQKRIVVILPDGGDRYFSTPLISE
ncbi:cysteine synthase A [[Eubacterium] hominis]|uniref:cysteine synthase A n=1 Tax=[Eubacterium] hominis TaxID=2764325 RepID=UPI003A4E3DA9